MTRRQPKCQHPGCDAHGKTYPARFHTDAGEERKIYWVCSDCLSAGNDSIGYARADDVAQER